MIKPVRLQRTRKKGAKLVSPNGLPIKYVGRPTKWGNPFDIKTGLQEAARDFKEAEVKFEGPNKREESAKAWIDYAHAIIISKYRNYLQDHPELVEQIKKELKGKNLSCWCDLSEKCHASILLEIANQ